MELELEQQQQSYRAVVDRVASPAHHVQDVVGPVHLTVDAVQDCVVCSGHTHTLFMSQGSQSHRDHRGHRGRLPLPLAEFFREPPGSREGKRLTQCPLLVYAAVQP